MILGRIQNLAAKVLGPISSSGGSGPVATCLVQSLDAPEGEIGFDGNQFNAEVNELAGTVEVTTTRSPC